MKAAKLLIGIELAFAVLSGALAIVNDAQTGPPAETVLFTCLSVAALVSTVVMASLLWLFNLPAEDPDTGSVPDFDLAA
ncbi:MAG TPA: hypothetical protein VF867_11945 [Arthrobacter sp.]